MKKKHGIAMIALATLIFPVVKIQAEEVGANASASVQINGDMGGKPDMPPPGAPGQQPPMDDTRPESGREGRPILKNLFERGDKPMMEERGQAQGNAGMNAEMRGKGMELSAEEKAKVQADRDARKAEILKKIAAVKAEVKVKLDANAQARIKNILDGVFKRLSNQIDRLANIDGRLTTKIAELSTSGTDTSAMSAAQVSAQAALAKARIDVEATSSLSIDQTATETSKEALRAIVKTAEDSIKAARDAYKKVIDLLPDASVNASVNSQTSVGQ